MSDFRLPRLNRGFSIADKAGSVSELFRRWWQSVVEKIETQEAAQDSMLSQIATILGLTTALDAAVTAAQDAADTATAAAAGANSVASLTNSGVTGLTLSASDAGANATITISGHTRVYGDGTAVSVTGGTVTGQPYSTTVFIYYDQPSRLGGAVTFLATTSDTTAAQTGDRHLVGRVTTPAAAGAPNSGDGVQPPGIGNIP